ncbi:S8 family peptidase [Actinorhabdospora filicis]|uniref:S8 family peptidase n=1 Tax=Actinorhabdospora filicis TaxID=1785913 RepID=UPI002557B33D|nr:S8 family peptidase [Actinorhabdospora filicis]
MPGAAAAGEGTSTPPTTYTAGRYIVELEQAPASSYEGDVAGLSATQPKDGDRLNPDGFAVKRYRNYLAALRNDVLAIVPGAEVSRTYDTVFNGFTAELSASEAATLAKTKGVKGIYPDEEFEDDTVTTPDFLGLTGSNGVWQKQYQGVEHAGEGVIVGVIDSGYVPENGAFGALPEPRPDQAIIDAKWNGTCQTGTTGDPTKDVACNNKVIGARWYKNNVTAVPEEFDSPRDYHGHGSHTASTAAGNNGVDAIIGGQNVGKISGMAPAARLAIYKVCWRRPTGNCGANAANSVAAIEDAVNDGVDVINFSISGSNTVAFTAVQTAYFNAAAAGVFVANSAGNDGPGSTVNHNTPWTTTVAASTHGRAYSTTLTLGNGVTAVGAGRGSGLPSSPIVQSKDIAKAGSSVAEANLCFLGTLDPAKAAGKLVVCQRGTNARTDKSQEVKNAGGVGMILRNIVGGGQDIASDFHAVPSVHLTAAEAQKVLDYLAGSATPTGALAPGVYAPDRAPTMADFSSAGPAIAGGGDLLKPDITAPGVDVIAAYAPAGNGGANFASAQGTSMSSPHIAGIAALVKGKHPDWTPMMVKSALMTTATTLDNQGKPIQRAGHDATVFDYGSGHVRPSLAFDPGLVYNSDQDDWLAWGCGIGELQVKFPDVCAQDGNTIDPTQLNYPSVSIGNFVKAETVTRTVTNVGKSTSTYFAVTEAPKGTKMTISPTSLVLRPGQSASFKITITRTDAALGVWTSGSYTWKDLSGHVVRSPVVLKPGAVATPKEVAGKGVTGSVAINGVSGYAGQLNASVIGLGLDNTSHVALSNPQSEGFPTNAPVESDHTKKVEVTVPAGKTGLVDTFDNEYETGTDIDLYAYVKNADGSLTAGPTSGSEGATEHVSLPGGATYVVFVDLFDSPRGEPVDGKLHAVSLGGNEGNLSLSPASQYVTVDKAFTVTGSWTGLLAGRRYYGVVVLTDGTGAEIARVPVTVTT